MLLVLMHPANSSDAAIVGHRRCLAADRLAWAPTTCLGGSLLLQAQLVLVLAVLVVMRVIRPLAGGLAR